MEFKHISVLKEESIVGLNIKPDGVYVDCTTGGGGHSLEIAKKLTTGRLICLRATQPAKALSPNFSTFLPNLTSARALLPAKERLFYWECL